MVEAETLAKLKPETLKKLGEVIAAIVIETGRIPTNAHPPTKGRQVDE